MNVEQAKQLTILSHKGQWRRPTTLSDCTKYMKAIPVLLAAI